eukprot:COSAG06_NODE_54157_length_296_cov_0.761421_1_plen_53_part_10
MADGSSGLGGGFLYSRSFAAGTNVSLLCGDGGNDGDAAALLAAAGGAPMWGKR